MENINVVKEDGSLFTVHEFETALAHALALKFIEQDLVLYAELCDLSKEHGMKTAVLLRRAMDAAYGPKTTKFIKRTAVSGWWPNVV